MQWTRAGEELRQLADAFSRSKERQSVKHRVEKLNLETLDFDNFFKLLEELFQVSKLSKTWHTSAILSVAQLSLRSATGFLRALIVQNRFLFQKLFLLLVVACLFFIT